MGKRIVVFIFSVLLVSSTGHAKSWETFEGWQDYLSRHRTQCFAPFANLRKKPTRKIGKSTFRLEGTKLVEVKPRRRASTRIGVISAPKDATTLTRDNVGNFVDVFKARSVDWIVVNGDLAYESETLPEVLEVLGKSGLPVFINIGNGESVAPFNDALLVAMEKHTNVFNTNFIRLVEGAGLSMVTMPGYYDPKYIHPPDGCHYTPENIKSILELARLSKRKPRLLISHGPPKGVNTSGLDVIHNGTNVGDPMLNEVMAKNKIRYGIFGHILEAGGRGVNTKQEPVEPGVKSKSLWVNAGSASAIPWKMLGGTVGEGIAMIVTIGAKAGSYEVVTATEARMLKWKAGTK